MDKNLIRNKVKGVIQKEMYRDRQWSRAFGKTHRRNGQILRRSEQRNLIDTGLTERSIDVSVTSASKGVQISISYNSEDAEHAMFNRTEDFEEGVMREIAKQKIFESIAVDLVSELIKTNFKGK